MTIETGLAPATLRDNYPADGTEADRWRFLLHFATLAPSERNTQPWLFRIVEGPGALQVELHADGKRAVHEVDPDERELIISCGAALYHCLLAVRRFGHFGDIDLLPNAAQGDLLATIRFGTPHEPAPGEIMLFNAMKDRHTNRTAFTDRPVETPLIHAVQAAAADQGVWLFETRDAGTRSELADLVAEADRTLFSNPGFRAELARWIRHQHTSIDGVPENLFGMPDKISYAEESFVADTEAGEIHAARDRDLALSAPALLALGSAADTPHDWLRIGMALSAVLLRASAEGLSASFLNTPVQVPALRTRLARIIGHGGFPQLMIRLGYGQPVARAGRRPVGDVLLNERPLEGTATA